MSARWYEVYQKVHERGCNDELAKWAAEMENFRLTSR